MFIFDAHCDTLYAGHELQSNAGQFDITRGAARGPGIQVMAAFGDNQLAQLERLSAYRDIIGTDPNLFSLLPSVEGGDTIKSIHDLDPFLAHGIKLLGLTWNYNNLLAGGCFGKSEAEQTDGGDIGLTDLGREAVETLERNGVVIDLAHSSRQTFDDVIKAARYPVAVSHACCATLRSHARNLTDDQMRRLAERGGVLGITFYTHFLSDNDEAELSDVCRHIEYAVNIMGADHVGLGSDFDGCDSLPHGLSGTQDVPKLLLRLNLPESTVEKVAGLNFFRILR